MTKLKHYLLLCTLLSLASLFLQPAIVMAQESSQEACNADIDQKGTIDGGLYIGTVNLSDYTILVRDFLKTSLSNPRSNINKDTQNLVNLSDYSILARWFLKSVTCPNPGNIPTATPIASISPTVAPGVSSTEWNQDAGNAQRTGYTTEEPSGTWTYKWSFNGADGSGGTSAHLYNAPKEARTVTGTTSGVSRLFVPAGPNGLYAFDLATGNKLWNTTITSFIAAPAYDPISQSLYIGGNNGTLYKLDPSNGTIRATYPTGSSIRKAILIVGNFVYVVTDEGKLHKVSTSTMSGAANFPYIAGSPIDTPPAYSASKDIVVFATRDLNVYAVNNSSGSLRWKVKPTPNAPGAGGNGKISTGGQPSGAQFNLGWPVIADNAGVVLLRMQLDHQAHYQGPSWEKQADGTYRLVDNGGFKRVSNTDIKNYFDANKKWKSLFALSLDTGVDTFTPAVGYGSTEDYVEGVGTQGVMGSQPVVKTLPSGKQIAYIHFRSLPEESPNDYRWSGQMGEMVLDNSTINGYTAGDMRLVQLPNSNVGIVDEQEPLAVAGNTLFHNHWAGVEPYRITDRSDTKGSITSPILSTRLSPIMHAIKPCGTFSATTHFTSCTSVQYVTDGANSSWNNCPANDCGRTFQNTPGAFYSYWGVADPPGWKMTTSLSSGSGTSYSSGFQPRYTYVSNGYIITEGNGGDIMVFKHQ